MSSQESYRCIPEMYQLSVNRAHSEDTPLMSAINRSTSQEVHTDYHHITALKSSFKLTIRNHSKLYRGGGNMENISAENQEVKLSSEYTGQTSSCCSDEDWNDFLELTDVFSAKHNHHISYVESSSMSVSPDQCQSSVCSLLAARCSPIFPS